MSDNNSNRTSSNDELAKKMRETTEYRYWHSIRNSNKILRNSEQPKPADNDSNQDSK